MKVAHGGPGLLVTMLCLALAGGVSGKVAVSGNFGDGHLSYTGWAR